VYRLDIVAKKDDDLLGALGRFSEPALHVLIALAEGPRHGYAIMLDIESMTGNRPGPGTLYGAIARLEERGWIEPLDSDDRRRPYRLTPTGRRVLRAKVETLQAVTRLARARLANA
jgi:DNA-binding PadR family transcriptional regulator